MAMMQPVGAPADKITAIPANVFNTKEYVLPVQSYAGFIDVSKNKSSHLFYWFFEARNTNYADKPSEIPLVIWLNGGPGASSLVGLFLENGPVRIGSDSACSITENPASWNEQAHLMYWDQPVGTGYSYNSDNEFVKTEDELSDQFYGALSGFYALHPEYRECPLYITGESYAGKYVPWIAWKILENNKSAQPELRINLAGIAIGDGWMYPEQQILYQMRYGYEMGFVDNRQYGTISNIYSQFVQALKKAEANPTPQNWKTAVDMGNSVTQLILKCGGQPDIYDVRQWHDVSTDYLSSYLNNPLVKQLLKVPEDRQWVCADDEGPVYENLIADNMVPVIDKITSVVQSNIRVLMYTGNFDMSCGFVGTENILYNLDWNHQVDWQNLNRLVWVQPPDGTLGYIKSLANLTQVVIPDAGHLVPIGKPEVSRLMINNWLFGREFPSYDPMEPGA